MAQRETRDKILAIVAEFAGVISKEMVVSKIILFGSYSTGRQHDYSDIDVAVVSPDFTDDRIEDQLRLMKYRRTVDLRIEPMPFTPGEFVPTNPFVRNIVETGVVVMDTTNPGLAMTDLSDQPHDQV